MERGWKDKSFIEQIMLLAIPIALQNLITSSLNMIDTLMISGLGEASIAAVGLANQIFFFFILIAFGINTGSSVFISQYWGKKDETSVKKILGLALSITFLVGVIFTVVGFFFPEMAMKFFTKEADVVGIGSDYLRIVSLSYIVTGLAFSLGVASRSIGQARMPMIVSAISFVTNTVFNYLLIFGKFGFPKLGVKGAAYGTLIARLVELIATVYFIYKDKENPLAAKIGELFTWDMDFVKRYLRTTSPVILNETFWALGQVMYSVAYASIGQEATAAVQIVATIQNIFFVIVRGLGNACTVMVGNKIGSNQEEEAYRYAIRFLKMATYSGLFLGAILALTPDITLKLFRNISPDLYMVSKKMLQIVGVVFFVKTFNSTLVVGVLRGGGDTKFSMYLEMGSIWLIGVPLAFIGAKALKLPVYYVLMLVSLEEIVKAGLGLKRVISKKWIKNVT